VGPLQPSEARGLLNVTTSWSFASDSSPRIRPPDDITCLNLLMNLPLLASCPALRASLALSLLLALAACGQPESPKGPPGGGMPPPSVGVVTVQPGSVALSTELPGRLEAWRVAQVRARVPGIVSQRLCGPAAVSARRCSLPGRAGQR